MYETTGAHLGCPDQVHRVVVPSKVLWQTAVQQILKSPGSKADHAANTHTHSTLHILSMHTGPSVHEQIVMSLHVPETGNRK